MSTFWFIYVYFSCSLISNFYNVDAVIISKVECGPPFTCPERCTVQWEGACPTECACPDKKAQCLELACPADPPKCIIYTRHDGCQDCACEEPFRQIHIRNVQKMLSGELIVNSAHNTSNTALQTPGNDLTDESQSLNHNRFDNDVIQTASLGDLAPRPPAPSFTDEHLRCTEVQHQELRANFGGLDAELSEVSRLFGASSLFPALFAYSRSELRVRCDAYTAAWRRTSWAAKRNCFDDEHVYVRVYHAYSFACGFGTSSAFSRVFACLQSLRFDPRVVACDAISGVDSASTDDGHAGTTPDPRSACAARNAALQCAKMRVVTRCGKTGWGVYARFLSVAAKAQSRNCRLNRGEERELDELRITLSPDAFN